MTEQLRDELNQLPRILESAKASAIAYLEQLGGAATTAAAERSGTDHELPEEGKGATGAMEIFDKDLRPLIVASSGPRYLGFVTGGTTPAAIAGDWLATAFDQNCFATDGAGDVSARIELATVSLLLQLFELPEDFMGGFVTGATLSNFTCLAVARQWAGHAAGKDIAREGLTGPLPVLAATPHSSAIKSLAMLGMGSSNIITIRTGEGNREAMEITDLEAKLKALNGAPAIVISSGGTVNTVDFDDMKAIRSLKQRYTFWWHIDAAFGAFAALSPQYRHLLQGWEEADSITVDCHKWLNVPYDSAVLLVKDRHRLMQVATFQNGNAPYLGDPLAHFSYLNLLPENSRRLRALPAWFTLMAYGRAGYRAIVENSILLAKDLGKKIEESARFQLLAPVRLNTVCFTLAGDPPGDTVKAFLDTVCRRGKVFMTPTFYEGKTAIRAAFVNWRTTGDDLNIIWSELLKVSEEMNAA